MGSSQKEELQGQAVEQQIKSKKEEVYTRMLAVFGIIIIFIATTTTIMADMRITSHGLALYFMGLFLFAAGMLWREKSKRKLEDIYDKIEHYEDEEDEGYRYDSAH